MHSYIKNFVCLTKFWSSAFITLSGLCGYALTGTRNIPEIIFLGAGLYLLISGCSALSQYQEREIDATMVRTRQRPIPSGRVSPRLAIILAGGLIFGGILLLVSGTSIAVLVLGISGILIYNGIYTNLKKSTPYAIFPGAIAGCLPPLMGWVYGGGSFSYPLLWSVLCFGYFWQIAHYGMLLLENAGDYSLSQNLNLYKYIGKTGIARMTLASIAMCISLSVTVIGAGKFFSNLTILIILPQLVLAFMFLKTIAYPGVYGSVAVSTHDDRTILPRAKNPSTEGQVPNEITTNFFRPKSFFRLWNSWLGLVILFYLIQEIW